MRPATGLYNRPAAITASDPIAPHCLWGRSRLGNRGRGLLPSPALAAYPQVPLYDLFEVSVTNDTPYANWFADVELNTLITDYFTPESLWKIGGNSPRSRRKAALRDDEAGSIVSKIAQYCWKTGRLAR